MCIFIYEKVNYKKYLLYIYIYYAKNKGKSKEFCGRGAREDTGGEGAGYSEEARSGRNQFDRPQSEGSPWGDEHAHVVARFPEARSKGSTGRQTRQSGDGARRLPGLAGRAGGAGG